MKKKQDGPSEESKKQIEEWKGKYVRALADYQNLEKRTRNEKEETRRFAIEVFVGRLLPVIDTLEKATKHIADQGLALALNELWAALSEFGVSKLDVLGKPFNPHEMECIEVVNGEENIVVEEVFAGYRLHDKIVRVAQVKVGKTMPNAK